MYLLLSLSLSLSLSLIARSALTLFYPRSCITSVTLTVCLSTKRERKISPSDLLRKSLQLFSCSFNIFLSSLLSLAPSHPLLSLFFFSLSFFSWPLWPSYLCHFTLTHTTLPGHLCHAAVTLYSYELPLTLAS